MLLLANALVATVLALRAQIEGFSTTFVGLIATANYLGLYIGAIYGDRLVNLVGHIRAFAIYASIASIAPLTHALFIDEFVWILFRFTSGVCVGGLVIITEAWLNSKAVNTNRGQIMAMYMITNYFGGGLGQLFIPFVDPATFKLFTIASIAFSLSLIPVLLTRFAAPEVYPRNPVRMRDLYLLSPVGMFCAFSAGMTSSALHGLGPVYVVDAGMPIQDAGYFMAALIFGGMLLQWHVGKLSDGMDRRKVIVGICICSALLAFFIVLATQISELMFIAVAVVYGAVSTTLYSVAAAHTNDRTSAETFLKAASGLLMAYGTGAIIGPLVAATFMEYFAPGALFIFLSIVFSANVLFVAWRMKIRSITPASGSDSD